MTERLYYIGGNGPFYYDDAETADADGGTLSGENHQALLAEGSIKIGVSGADDDHVMRRADIATGIAAGVSDAAYGAGWNGVTTIAPSKNSVYDKIEALGSGINHVVYPSDYGAHGDGTTNDTDHLQSAIDDLGADGGIVQLETGMRYLIDDADLDVEEFVMVRGVWGAVDQYTSWADRPGIIVNTSYSINLKASSALKNVMVLRKGLTGHEADETSFAGTAIDIASGAHGVQIEDTIILGFTLGILSTSAGRGIFRNVKGDCTNGIEVTLSADVTRVIDCHFWPFVTNTPGAGQKKAGEGIYFHDQVDWGIISRCFTYGFDYGIRLRNVHGVTISDCGQDWPNVAPTSGDSGILIDGSTNGQNNHISIRGNRAAGMDHGIRVDIANASDHPNITLIGNTSWECDTTHIGVYGDADISIIGNTCDGTSIGGNGILFDGSESITGVVSGNILKDLTVGINGGSLIGVITHDNMFQNCGTDEVSTSGEFGSWVTLLSATESGSGSKASGTSTTDGTIVAYIKRDSGDYAAEITGQTPTGTTRVTDDFFYNSADAAYNGRASISFPVRKGDTYNVSCTLGGVGTGTLIEIFWLPLR